jgi:hypothetical protein
MLGRRCRASFAASAGHGRVLLACSCLSTWVACTIPAHAAPAREIADRPREDSAPSARLDPIRESVLATGSEPPPFWSTMSLRLPSAGATGAQLPAPLLMAAAVVVAGADSGAGSSGPGAPRSTATTDPDGAAPVRWTLAPIRLGGKLGLEQRWSRSEDGLRSSRSLLGASADAASYIWQPWFIQLRAGLGLILSQGTDQQVLGPRNEDNNTSWTGRLGVQVFPASRFPFEARADVADSRTSGDYVGTDYRSTRYGFSQSYRPLRGNENYNLGYESSTLSTAGRPDDTVKVLRGLMIRTFGAQTLELSGSETLNERGGRHDSSQITSLAARHNYRPRGTFLVDNLATYNDIRVRNDASSIDLTTDITQLSTFVTWRPEQGQPLYSPDHPLFFTGSVRLTDSRIANNGASGSRQSADGTFGLSYDISRNLRAGGGLSVSRQKARADGVAVPEGDDTLSNQTATLTYTPDPIVKGAWRYSPNLSASASGTQGTADGSRNTESAQAGHTLSRSWLGESHGQLSLNFTQSLGATLDSAVPDFTRTLTHAVSLYRQFLNGGMTQSYAGLSLSDSRNQGAVDSIFQLANLQYTQRKQLTRNSSWSGNVTAQATRIRFDPSGLATPALAGSTDSGWRTYYSAGLSFENFHAFGVPRLRFIALANANSQQLERRTEGDLDAPRERINHLIEARLEYMIGRLETRVVARSSQVDDRRIDSIFFRIHRRFGVL